MRITFAALSIACMLSIGCGGGEDDAAPKKDASTTPASTPDVAASTTTVEKDESVDTADIQLVKLELPGMV